MQRPELHRRQRGAALIFALIALLVLGLATLALVRTVDTGSLLLGNMSFKQDATATGDQGVRAAFLWLKNQSNLGADQTAQGYYASTRESDPAKPVDVTGQQYPTNAQRQLIDWYPDDDALKNCAYASSGTCGLVSKDAGATPNGNNRMRYTIFRLCSMTDAQAAASGISNNCATPTGLAGGNHEAGERGPKLAASGAFYRIVVQVRGSRNSVSFLETIVQL
ncbi:hypothetical protein APR50_24110 [Variovorax paradoxus]|jgi:Tfp pilus assembly protein PilX|uniref:pilus assembly PilX family protein n=1 Tax=Variovorax paradoxus TaxID=34073 RepID=UPI0006E5AE64|nr:hypothetical protein APR52_28960 [Variovorax paradoxus]KPV03670.1 hypothetical protein APR50_24110 [Variovorax paradoxus]KPV06055.1 hypothetical protein APR49_20605 [Variovorax paradoxus]KPV19065.1 hypothetical protein APR51_21540 [Variovorax paradoxus]KPV29804.1 hypothetical protein APR48_21635 [Variovorax paradoxus]